MPPLLINTISTDSHGGGAGTDNPSSDVVSMLLDRGNKLKEAMIKSELETGLEHDLDYGYTGIFSPLKR